MSMKVIRTQIAAKIETTEGALETLAGADALLAANVSFKPNLEMGDRPNVTASLSPFSRVPGARSATMEFDVEIKSVTAGTAPALGKLLRACGFGETVVASTSVTYLPASTAVPSISIGAFMDGVIKRIWGARGEPSIKLESGKPGWIKFVFTGADFSVIDGVMLTTGVAYEATVPPAFLSAALTVDSYAALIGSMDIKMGNKIHLRKDINTASGFKSAVITDRAPALTLDPEFVTVATYDWYGKLRSGTLGALSVALLGAAGNRCTITAPKVQYTNINPADRDGWRTLGIDCALNRNAGDDEISIAFT